MIIEFNGLPGTGKTTIAKALGKKVNDLGIRVFYEYPIQETRIQRYISVIFDGSLWLFAMGVCFAQRAVMPKNQERWRYVSLLVKYYRMYRRFLKEQPDAVLIIDQGLLQAVASIVHMDEITDSCMLNRIFRWFKKRIDFSAVDCTNDPDLSRSRIRQRNSEDKRMLRWDNYDDETIMMGLDKQKQTISVIRTCSHDVLVARYVETDTQLSPDSNVEKIISAFMER